MSQEQVMEQISLEQGHPDEHEAVPSDEKKKSWNLSYWIYITIGVLVLIIISAGVYFWLK